MVGTLRFAHLTALSLMSTTPAHSLRRHCASSYGCKVSVITSPAGMVTQLDTEDYNPGGTGLIGLAGALGAYGSMCGMKLGMKPQS
jgi:hypothetical protein